MSLVSYKPELVPSWDYEPVPQYRGFVQQCSLPAGNLTSGFDTPANLIHILCMDESSSSPSMRQPMADFIWAIVDGRGYVVYGYSAEKRFVQEFGHPAWWGCAAGFALVEAEGLIDPVELAMREAVAREAIDAPDWWKS